jgi:2-aminoadipate transaminase
VTRRVISFSRGAPSLDIIDVVGLKEAAVAALERDAAGATRYGSAMGYEPLREWLAAQHGVSIEQVLVTNGSLQADDLLFHELVKPGEKVVVEAPTYDRTLASLQAMGADVLPVPLEPDGLDTAVLSRLSGESPSLAHLIPNFQNPAGYTLSEEKRREVVKWASEVGCVIFEDDPYREISFDGTALPTMLSLDDTGSSVLYASSFSKTVCPGIRVGYLVGPAEVIRRVAKRAEATYISPNMFAQATLYQYCASGRINQAVERIREELGRRCRTMAQALIREMPAASFVEPKGGYFFWVSLPENIDLAKLWELAQAKGVAFVKGTDFFLSGGEHEMRLAFAGVSVEEIEEGIRLLAEAAAEAAS